MHTHTHARRPSRARLSFQESLNRNNQLTQEALNDWPALGELVLHLNLQHVAQERHEGELLQHRHTLHRHGGLAPPWRSHRTHTDLSVPRGVGGVEDDGGAPLLTLVGELGEASPPAGLDGHLQVGVGVEEHPLLQSHGSDV